MSKWINTKIKRWKVIIKPCKLCGFCPYGQLVEEFRFQKKPNEISCSVFGHDCPVFYHAEMFSEEKIPTIKEIKAMHNEIEQKFRKLKEEKP